jgi:murein DD-endopeptidase MepM/ murein hydrolase activator NlpD
VLAGLGLAVTALGAAAVSAGPDSAGSPPEPDLDAGTTGAATSVTVPRPREPAGPAPPTDPASGANPAPAGSRATADPRPLADARERAAFAGRADRGATRPEVRRPAWVIPITGAHLTSCFGPRGGQFHAGVDLAAPAGTPVRAAGAGVVVTAGWSLPGYGISVLVDHGGGLRTHYAHLAGTRVRPGQRVAAGQVIGREGSTGDSTGPHLHFEVHRGEWRQVDPAAWLRARGIRIGC